MTDFKLHVDLYGFYWFLFSASHGALLRGPVEPAQPQYRAATARREIPGRSWRAIAPAGCWSRTLKAVWQYCRRGDEEDLAGSAERDKAPLAELGVHVSRLGDAGEI